MTLTNPTRARVQRRTAPKRASIPSAYSPGEKLQ